MTALPKRKNFTVDLYHEIIDAGVFVGNSDFELIEGEIDKNCLKTIYILRALIV